MHKTVIALAIAGMAAAPAFADSNVTLYGSIDYGFGIRSGNSTLTGNAALSKQEFVSGTDVYNRLGFKGSEDLGNGTKVIFEIEMGFLADTGENSIGVSGATPESNGLFRNHSWVGLTGDWGTVVGGRVDGSRYSVSGRYDPFNNGTVATLNSLNGQAQRADNAVAYITPSYEGLYAVIAYTSSLIGQEAPGNNGDLRLYVLPQLNYTRGPLSVTLNYEHLNVHNSSADAKINVYDVGVSYDFGVAKIMALWDHVKTDTNAGTPNGPPPSLADEQTWFIGGIVPVSENDKLRVVYGQVKDRTATKNSCNKWGIGGEHYMSKRTNLYLDFASITEKDNGGCTIFFNAQAPADAAAGTGTGGGGVGTRGLDMGIVHRF
jgi:predicted porin